MNNANSRNDTIHLAVDTGGTFTDIGVRRPDGSLVVWKVPSTPNAPDEAVIDGIVGAMDEYDFSATEITRLVHGTTVATNTVLTREGAKIGLLTTTGFRDVLAIAHQARPSIYDNSQQRVTPLIPQDLIVEIEERMAADGSVLQALNTADLEATADKLQSLQLDALVVSFLNAYANQSHEDEAVRFLRERDVAPIISSATDITAEMREYDRTSTAAVNAYVQPKVSSYMGRLENSIRDLDIPSRLWIMQSNGGLLNPVTASEHSARTVLSGLAGGVVGAANWARLLELDKVVSFDIGGTSTDIALIRNGQPDETTSGEIDSLPLRLPSVDVHTIGAGGGSIAWRDSGGGLRVGPHSAGAVPGPISYSKGGTELTVTDAHVVLGRLGEKLLGGRFTLDRKAARKRMEQWGSEMGLSAEETAEGILRVISATMARGIRNVSVERGIDVRSCHLMSFGGAGPLHGADLAHELGMESAVIPPHPGIASAVGMLDAPVRHDFAAPVSVITEDDLAELPQVYQDLESKACDEMGSDEFDSTYFVDARYIGQSYELTIPFEDSWDKQRESFDQAHAERYGFHDPDAEVEIVVARLTASVHHDNFPEARISSDGQPEIKEHREVFINGQWVDTPIYDRSSLPANSTITGPAIIDQFDSTTYVRPNQDCFCDEYGFLHLTQTANTDTSDTKDKNDD